MRWETVRRILAVVALIIVASGPIVVYQVGLNQRRADSQKNQCRLWDGIHAEIVLGPSLPLTVPNIVTDPSVRALAEGIVKQANRQSVERRTAALRVLGPRPPCPSYRQASRT